MIDKKRFPNGWFISFLFEHSRKAFFNYVFIY